MNGFTGIETGRKDRIVGLFSQAHSLAISGDYKGALRLYDRIIVDVPGLAVKTPQINYERALCLKALGRIGQAEQAVCACLAAKPDHPDSLRLLSEIRSIKKIGNDAKRRLETQPGVTIIDHAEQAHQLLAEVKTFLPLVEEADVRQALKAISLIEKRIIGRYCGDIGDKVLQYLSIVQFVRATSSKTVDSIEIGTLFGGSCLTKLFAMRDLVVSGKIVCIDPMTGYYEQPIDPIAGIAVTAKVFFENVTRFGFPKESVELREVKSNNPRGIEGLREKSYATLMIDGDHSYNGVRYDWENYSRFVSDKGIVLFDDYANRAWPDIGIFVNELKGSLPCGWRELGCLGTTLLLDRSASNGNEKGQEVEKINAEIRQKQELSNFAQKQQQVLNTSRELLSQYKDRHRGQRCVIIGNGPSLNKMDLSFLKNEITFGMNRIYLLFDKWDFRPTYYVSVNPLVIEQSVEKIREITAPRFLTMEGLPYIGTAEENIFIQRRPGGAYFSDDPRKGCWWPTVTYAAMQLAYFMGFSEVILIGVDHYFKTKGDSNKEIVSGGVDEDHFHPDYFGKGIRWNLPDLEKSEVAYRLAKQAFEAAGRRIMDATVDGHLTIFPKADYKEIFFPTPLPAKSFEFVLSSALVDTEFEEYFRTRNEKDGASVAPTLPKLDPPVSVESREQYLVSAIVSTYNSEHFLRGCLEDLERQTIAGELEIVVVNSGSQQNEEAIVKEFQQKYDNIVYIRTEQREGIYSAWNRAARVAQGTYLTNANTDDRHRNDALEIMAKTLQENPDIALVYGDQICTDTPNGTFDRHHSKQIAKRPEYTRERLLLGCCVGSQPMWRKSLHSELGFFDETLTCASDWDFWLRISSKYKFKHIPDFLGLYYYNKDGIEHGRKIHSLYERYIVGRRYGNPYISVIPVYKNKDNPLVSVIMPAYNAAAYIAEAIESVLIQNYRNFELLIINDGSTDNTEEIVAGFKDKSIKYFRQENRGLAATHNAGIRHSRGEFVIKLDADDMMTPDFIARHLQEFEKHPEASLVYCDDYLIDRNDKPIRILKRPEYTDRKLLIRDMFRSGFPVVPFRTCIRKNVFDKIGFFDENLPVAEDYDMMRRFVKHGLKICHLTGALYLRKMTENSLSRNLTPQKAKSHFELVKRFVETFSYDELFPDVDWDEIPADKRQLHAKCLAVVNYLAIGQDFSQSNSTRFYANIAFEHACSELRDCLKIDPDNRQIQELLQKCELGRQRYEKHVQQAVC
ncbi:MAG: glycosyltransferase [Sedimentisphaerales bacterium]